MQWKQEQYRLGSKEQRYSWCYSPPEMGKKKERVTIRGEELWCKSRSQAHFSPANEPGYEVGDAWTNNSSDIFNGLKTHPGKVLFLEEKKYLIEVTPLSGLRRWGTRHGIFSFVFVNFGSFSTSILLATHSHPVIIFWWRRNTFYCRWFLGQRNFCSASVK